MRGDIHRINPAGSGHEQRGTRFGIILQSDDLPLSTVLVAPTSTSALPLIHRPQIELDGQNTAVLLEQTAAVTASRLGAFAGRVSAREMQAIDAALLLVFGLD